MKLTAITTLCFLMLSVLSLHFFVSGKNTDNDAIITSTLLEHRGEKNLEIEIIGVSPNTIFEVSFHNGDCNSRANHNDIVIASSDKSGVLLGFIENPELNAINVRNTINGKQMCLETNV